MLRVPLIMRVPGQPRGRVIDAAVGLVDVLPTVLDVLGIDAEHPTQGLSLVPLWAGGNLAARAYYGEASQEPGSAAIRVGGLKFIRHRAGRDELYKLADDGAERLDRCRDDRELCKSLRLRLRDWISAQRELAARLELPEAEEAIVDEEMAERLRAMGYVD